VLAYATNEVGIGEMSEASSDLSLPQVPEKMVAPLVS
jgi:hypothetical protein